MQSIGLFLELTQKMEQGRRMEGKKAKAQAENFQIQKEKNLRNFNRPP